jgi:hypothetical protein
MKESSDREGECAFAASTLTNQAQDFSRAYFQRQVAKDIVFARIVDGQTK